MHAGTIQVRGGTLETAWWGPGPDQAPTLVLLHEGLGSVALWRDVPERLAASTGWGVFAYSRFGYGNSDPTALPRPMTYMHHEAQVVLPQVLLAAAIEQAVLIGHSDGGSIAVIYAGSLPGHDTPSIDRQPRLLGLVTIAAHFIVEDPNIVSIREIKAEYETGNLRQRLTRYHRDVDIAFRGWNDAWLDPRFRDFDLTGLLRHIRVPILGLQGVSDPYCTEQQIAVLRASVRTAIATRLIAGARHSPHLEAGAVTLAAITDFIANLPRGALT
jgi:pimeloyl-ACP methyl ester carboxylesterase